jgi:hypothetical protein
MVFIGAPPIGVAEGINRALRCGCIVVGPGCRVNGTVTPTQGDRISRSAEPRLGQSAAGSGSTADAVRRRLHAVIANDLTIGTGPPKTGNI